MYHYIMNSSSKEDIKKISIWKESYTFNSCRSSNALFKVLVCESRLDTKTTTTYIRQCLVNLLSYMHKLGNNILKFNTYVKGLIQSLNKHGKTTYNLLVNVSNGYLVYKDKAFQKYISVVIERDEDDPMTKLKITL